jgi:hypothetical protein
VSMEMTEGRLRWVIAGFAFFVGVAYFVWLSAVYIRFMDTNRRITEMATEFYTRPAEAEAAVIPEDTPSEAD